MYNKGLKRWIESFNGLYLDDYIGFSADKNDKILKKVKRLRRDVLADDDF